MLESDSSTAADRTRYEFYVQMSALGTKDQKIRAPAQSLVYSDLKTNKKENTRLDLQVGWTIEADNGCALARMNSLNETQTRSVHSIESACFRYDYIQIKGTANYPVCGESSQSQNDRKITQTLSKPQQKEEHKRWYDDRIKTV